MGQKNDLRQIIWSTDYYTDENAMSEWSKDYEEANGCGLPSSEQALWEMWREVVDEDFCIERECLDREVDGIVVKFADWGRWNGRGHSLRRMGTNVRDILQPDKDCEDGMEFYSDGDDIRSTQWHHDGTNYNLYRVVGDDEGFDMLVSRLYEGMSEEEFIGATKSLYPYIAEIYGWEIRDAREAGQPASHSK